MGNYLNPGNSGFAGIRNDIYVDKSGLIGLINQTIDTPRRMTCVSRPRRFGKSFAAQMLCAYYDKTCDSAGLFDGLEIADDVQFRDYLNRYDDIVHKKYPVLFDTYKDFVHEKITNSKQTEKNLMQRIGTYMNLFRYLIRFMDELALKYKADSFDVNSLTEIDVRKIITSKDVPVTYIKNFGYYLTYLK